ncbi:SufD family Fe-S cluster assembly protein [Patescibacteria group bacterium]|nr:SufD family Fe-S cluster assembly protein [Patescibacteria group bacterium]
MMEQISIEGEKTLMEQVSGKVEKSFTLGKNATLRALFIVREAELTLHIEAAGVHSKAVITCIFLSKNAEKIVANVSGNLVADHAGVEIYLLSLLGDNADCQVDGGVTISPDIIKSSGHLREENIVLGKKVKIKTLPMLDVRSSDVSASHGATIDRLDE